MRTWLPLLLLFTACDDELPGTQVTDCLTPRAMFSVQNELGIDGACKPELERLWGRAAQVNLASGTLWSRKTPHGTGILVTAAHVAALCGPESCPTLLRDVAGQDGQASVALADTPGDRSQTLHAMFPLFNVETPADELGDHLAQIKPVHDFSLLVVDNQHWTLNDNQIAPVPDPVQKAPLELHDPANLTTMAPTHADPVPGETVILLGYPNDRTDLTASVATVLDDAEANQAIADLAAAGDEEGSIPYDPEVEVLVRGPAGIAAPGMSGGGLYDHQGRYVGVLVRASIQPGMPQIVRAVRMRYILGKLDAAFSALEPAQQTAVGEFLEN